MTPRKDVSEQRKHQILDAAEEVFTRKGIAQARMDDIVEQTGLSKGTLYWYFKNKDAIIIAILDRIFLREFEQLEVMKDTGVTAVEGIWLLTDTIVQDMVGVLRLMPIAYEFLALAFRSKVVQKVVTAYFNRYLEILVPLIQRGIDNGEFRPVDAQEVAIAAGAIFEGTILLWVYDKNQVNPEAHIRSGIRLLLEGVQAKP
jgi:AcrR family transcriptional regulator